MLEIRKIEVPNQDCVHVIRDAFITVADEMRLTRQNAPTNPAFLEMEALQAMADKGVVFFGSFQDGNLVGFVAIEKADEDVYYMEKLAVLPAYRHHGYGARLIRHVMETVGAAGGKKVSIGIVDGNTILKNWYARNGFTVTGIRQFAHLPFQVCFMERDVSRLPVGDPSDGGVLVDIPGGDVRMRDDRKKRIWVERVPPFLLQRVPVTQGMYASLTGKNPSFFPGEAHPVETVSWLDAIAFCNLLSERDGLQTCYTVYDEQNVVSNPRANGYRLPTDAQWQHACQAGTGDARYGVIEDIAWYKGNAQERTHPVGEKQPNAFGLYDMIGNVWEWCWDQYDPEVYGPYRVFRGGGWCDEERGCLATNRRRGHPTFRIDDLGFRVARLP